MAELTEGWGWPAGSRKAHYFVDTMALCRGYGLYGGALEADTAPSPDDCATCRKALERRRAAAEREG